MTPETSPGGFAHVPKLSAITGGQGRTARTRASFAVMAVLWDVAAICAAAIVAGSSYHLIVHGNLGPVDTYVQIGAIVALLVAVPALARQDYDIARYIAHTSHGRRLFQLWNMAFLAGIALGFFTKTSDIFSRGTVVVFYVLGFVLLLLARRLIGKLVRYASKTGAVEARRIFLVGTSEAVVGVARRYQPWNYGVIIVGSAMLPAAPEELAPTLGRAVSRARALMPDDIYVLVPWAERRTLDTCLDAFLTTPAAIHIGADPLLDRFTDTDLCRVGEMTSIQVARRPLSAIEVAQKRAFDLAGAVLLLVLLSPLLAAIAIAIRLDSSGPAIFRQRRYGFNQNPFRIFKFRTMHTMDDGPVVRQATRDDARVTRIGRFLRRWNLDELPQLLNVLMGDMSLVGPRPHAVSHDDEYGRKLSLYARRHNVRPGITGWAQVHGLRGITDTDDKMSKRLAHDLYYIDNWSLLLDVQILIRTLVSAKSYRNAH